MSDWQPYTQRKSGKKIEARRWVDGEDMTGIHVHEGAQMAPGSMICRDETGAQWYMYEGAFRYNYGDPQ